jgi:hypothetical protein
VRSRRAIAASIILHAALVLAVSRGSWRAADGDDREPPPAVVWLSETMPTRIDAAADVREHRSPPDDTDASEVVDAAEAADPAAEAAEAADRADPANPADPVDAPRRAIVEAQIDWQREARRVVDSAREQREREARYRTFSLSDVVPGSPPQGEPRPRRSVFDSPAAGRAGLSYQDASGATVRWISDACYSVSGGVGNIFAFPLSVAAADLPNVTCVRLIPRSDLFEHIKPAYLLTRPGEPASVRERESIPE